MQFTLRPVIIRTFALAAAVVLAHTPRLLAEESCKCCEPTSEKAGEAAEKHPLKGVIRRVNAEKSRITVKHEEIPGFMAAMTMVFTVTPEDAKRLKEGQQIEGVLSRKDGDWILSEIRVVNEAK
ncbi:MAG: copper-binding protein [Opitutaceae bacterium]|nr:copper-binding protein [Opitutaceae bacterium]